MAVYTLINRNQLESILAYYDLGHLVDYSPIIAGTTNSNYKIELEHLGNKASYILTIVEQKLRAESLDFCVRYAQHLSHNKINAAAPIKNHSGLSTIPFLDKTVLITPFIEGHSVVSNSAQISTSHCQQLGKTLGQMHRASKNFSLTRKNPAGLSWCIKTFKGLDDLLSAEHFLLIKEELEYLILNYNLFSEYLLQANHLTAGAIHADLFCDNVIFYHDKIAGIIDFFYACTDYYLYDLAIVVNEWTLDYHQKHILKQSLYTELIKNYFADTTGDLIIKRNSESEKIWQVMLRHAALRFWLLRLKAFYNPNISEFKTIKDPKEYELKLLFHRENKLALEFN